MAPELLKSPVTLSTWPGSEIESAAPLSLIVTEATEMGVVRLTV